MKTQHLLISISTLAFSASALNAQNANITDSTGAGNTTICSNGGPGSTGNSCTIVQVGDNNNGTITQPVSDNFSRITTTGNGNLADHTQNGRFGTSTTLQNGNGNSSTIIQSGDYHRAAASQTGNGTSSSHVSNIRQAGNDAPGAVSAGGNIATVTQRALVGYIASQRSSIQQVGTGNTASVTQDGAYNSASIIQGNTTSPSGVPTDSRIGNSNIAIIINGGVANRSSIDQSGGPAGPPIATWMPQQAVQVGQAVQSNYALIDVSNDPSTPGLLPTAFNGNQAWTIQPMLAAAYNGNQASIIQRSSNNKANIVLRGGGAGTNANSATVIQDSFAPFVVMSIPFAPSDPSSNEAFVSLSQGNQMRSNVTQTGFDNYADVTMTSGVSGNDPVTTLSGGNSSTIIQSGRGQSAVVTVGSRTQFQGLGNQSTILQLSLALFQGRVLDANLNSVPQPGQSTSASEGRIAYTEGGPAGNFSGSRGNYSEVWQQGRFDFNVIQQIDAGESGRTYADGRIARARAAIYQSSQQGIVFLLQFGDNFGEVTQALGTGSSTSLTQIDTGDIEVVPPFPGPSGFIRQYNQALVTQYGNTNEIDAVQQTRNGYMSLFQRTGSSNNLIAASQGTGSSAFYSCLCGPYVGNPLSASPPIAAATQVLTQNVTQGGTNNAVRIDQDATNSFVTVTQLGSGDTRAIGSDFLGFGNTVGNQIMIGQQGNNNRAFATQTTTVGASDASGPASGNDAATNAALTGDPGAPADEFYFAGGARSPEIDILQAGADNIAIAEQRGRGQYARIDQGPGTGNIASILQDTGATNGTAVIRQSGSFNSFYVVQTQPGQYISVEQTGNNNAANSIIFRGTGGSFGFTLPPGI